MKTKKKGKFIVFYGINNLGKTTQANLLVKYLKRKGIKAEYVKYPVYDLKPAGPLINSYLRKGNPHKFSPRELQLLHFIDRIMFNPLLQKKLESGINIIAEDYFGTAVAWGSGAGVSQKFLENLYSFVYKEDIAILFDGERFIQSIEKKHKHENDNELINKVRKAHLRIAKKFNWKKVNANLPIETLHLEILGIIKNTIKK